MDFKFNVNSFVDGLMSKTKPKPKETDDYKDLYGEDEDLSLGYDDEKKVLPTAQDKLKGMVKEILSKLGL